MTVPVELDRAVRLEMMRRIAVEEEILRAALEAGAATVEITWPNDTLGPRRIFELPKTRRARRRLLKAAETHRHRP